ncbi:hypothetical protein GWF38_06690 [Campylobacter upsaliensis]|nr:hypothetical protein [Campylobacter upsaliensis]
MQISLVIENADEKLLKALKGAIALYPNAKLKSQKKQILTENGYSKEFEEKLLKEAKDMQENPHLHKAYDNTKEMFEDILNG